jgi:predicted nucleic acid-binding protein
LTTAAYLDTSALVRLLHAERYSDDLEAYLNENDIAICTSDLSRTEIIKALGTARYDEKALERFFSDITVYPITTADFEAAGKIGLVDRLRSLDAIHIQIAIHHSLGIFVTYDKRQFGVVGKSGIQAVAPGMG